MDRQFDPSVTWDDLAWVRRTWPGQLVLKGILDPDDARRAADEGVDGIVVSNHGGRQLDGAPSTIPALPAVAEAVGDGLEVLVDGGHPQRPRRCQGPGARRTGLPGGPGLGLGRGSTRWGGCHPHARDPAE